MSQKLRFYTDEHVANSVVKGLRLRGIDVLTTKDAGMLGESDEEHIALAKEQRRVVFTQDDDFLRLHAQGCVHSGIVYAHQRTSLSSVIRGLTLIYHVLDRRDMQNHVEFL